jgi:GNAT superfamily N-acetyltransferase
VALRSGDLDAARAAAAEALRWAEEAGDTVAAGLVHRVRGLIARAEAHLDEASEELELSLSAAVGDPDPGAWIAAANALALVRAARRDGRGAVELLGEALERARRMGMRHVEAALENNLADQFHAAGDEEHSREHLRRAVAIFAELGGTPGELEPEIWKLESW